MPKFIFIVVIGALASSGFNSCKKNNEDAPKSLPELTNTGANTFGCLIDGELYVAYTNSSLNGPQPIIGSFDESTKLLKLQSTSESEDGVLTDLLFQVYVNSGVGTYSMYVLGEIQIGFTDYSGPKPVYYHNINNPGLVEITYLNTQEKIVSGKFEMTLVNPSVVDSAIDITDGRFDFLYDY